MTQEEKDKLLKYLCMALPYGVKAQVLGWDEEKGEVEVPLRIYSINTDGYVYFENNDYDVNYLYVDEVKPYLRPMESMTEEEKGELYSSCGIISLDFERRTTDMVAIFNSAKVVDYFKAHHFDFMGLIPIGAAIDCTNLNVY